MTNVLDGPLVQPDPDEGDPMPDETPPTDPAALVLGGIATIDGSPAQRAALFAALAEAQGGFPAIEKSRSVDVSKNNLMLYSFDYAPLEVIQAVCRPYLHAAGLAVLQPFGARPSGAIAITTIIAHKDGASMTTALPVDLPPEPQKAGSLITYMRRYAYCAALGVTPGGEDDDAAAVSGQTHAPRREAFPASEVTPKAGPTPVRRANGEQKKLTTIIEPATALAEQLPREEQPLVVIEGAGPANAPALAAVRALARERVGGNQADCLAWVVAQIGRPIARSSELTAEEADRILDAARTPA